MPLSRPPQSDELTSVVYMWANVDKPTSTRGMSTRQCRQKRSRHDNVAVEGDRWSTPKVYIVMMLYVSLDTVRATMHAVSVFPVQWSKLVMRGSREEKDDLTYVKGDRVAI